MVMATVVKFEPKKNTKKTLTTQQKKLLSGPTMTKEQIKEFEKDYPWLKKVKD